ncbi:MAG: cupin domain-containing protein [Dehalococcoidales bacterium]|jgi:quercetin dioxygenase-like cupin family protein|nr:cupin domain-containing protein [Dehalococcoidales bacterium]
MYVIGLDQVRKFIPPMEGAQGVYKQIPLSRADGVPNFSFRVFTIEPGGHTPLHRHPFEHMNYIIEGKGVLAGEDGEKDLKKGDFALILPNELHQFKNTADQGNLVLICAVPKEFE